MIFLASSGTFDVVGDHIWFPTTKRVFHSGDRGKTWDASSPLWPDRPVLMVAYRDTLRGLAFSDRDLNLNVFPEQFKRTQDGGSTWTTIYVGDWPNVHTGLEYVPGSGGVYWSVSPTHTALSTDNGETWSFQTVPELFWFAEFLSPTVGWGAGATHPTPPTSALVMYKWVGDSLLCEPCDSPSAVLEPSMAGNLPLEITPNPVTDQFSVLIAGSPSEAFVLRLYDMSGRVALRARVFGDTKATFDIGGLAAGVYQVEVAGTGRSGVGRVVKE
jgi:hypothetical protein